MPLNKESKLNAKAIMAKEHQWYYLIPNQVDKSVDTSLKGLSPKVNMIAQPEFKFALRLYNLGTFPLIDEYIKIYVPILS